MELILCEKPKVGRDTARLLGIQEQHREYIIFDALPRLKPVGFGGVDAAGLLRGLTSGSRPEKASLLQN